MPNLFSLSFRFWIPLLIIWLIFYPLQAYFYYKSLKFGEISSVLPLMSLIPIFNVIFSFVLLGELPTVIGFLGIACIVLGIYILNLKLNSNFFVPITHLFSDKPSLFMIINCLCLSIGTTLDKIAIQASNPLFYSFVNTTGASLILLLIALKTNKNFVKEITSNSKILTLLGVFQGLAFSAFIVALSTGLVAYVNAVKSSSVILASIWGFIFLREKFTLQKSVCLILILVGLVLIAKG